MSKNKGEWSEILVKLILKFEKTVSLSTHDLKSTENKIQIIEESEEKAEDDEKKEGHEQPLDIESHIQTITKYLKIKGINSRKKRDAAIEYTVTNEKFSEDLKEMLPNQVADSSYKADIIVDISIDENIMGTVGFSIKSFLGGNPTLFNSSSKSIFTYLIKNIVDAEIKKINQIVTRARYKKRIEEISKKGNIEFLEVKDENFKSNLEKVHEKTPECLGKLLLDSYRHENRKILSLIKSNKVSDKVLYRKVISEFLLAAMCYLTSTKIVEEKKQAQGLIISKWDEAKDKCMLFGFHKQKAEPLKEYLLHHSEFATPSSSKCRIKCGEICKSAEGEENLFNLNLQVRLFD